MTKPPSLNEIRARAARFAAAWADTPGDERQFAQTFVRDLLAVYGITESRAAQYEYRARRASTGGAGYIDALVPGLVLIEMKSAGHDLAAAERQAFDYLDDLGDEELPTYLLTSDFRRFRLLDRLSSAVVEFGLGEFALNADRLAFLAGYGVRPFGSPEQEAASVKAARLMAGLYEMLEGTGYDDHEASVFLVRTLFCLYADDAGLWERDLFTEFLATRTAPDGSDLGAQLAYLFQVLGQQRRQSGLDELIARFPYVNGGVFDGAVSIPAFDAEMRGRLLAACGFNWAAISPAVFGSLFQAVKSKEARRTLGEHYTTETNIMKLIRPMFLDELQARFKAARGDVRKLDRLRADMGAMRFLDPACGCGNFLVVAYREMRALDLAILKRLQELDPARYGKMIWFDADDLPVRLSSFAGIEIDEWPARIAATALHLVEHQANQAMELVLGRAPETLPLGRAKNITVGNALRLDWAGILPPSDHLFVLGNPPFLGDVSRSEDQKDDLHAVWGRDDTGRLDYVTGWHAKALNLFSRPDYDGQFAFVSTNSITQGEPVPALFHPIFDAGWRIKFAHRTFAWTSEAPGAAAVHCVILGFDRASKPGPRLFDYPLLKSAPVELPVEHQINAYLIDGPNIIVEARREPLCPNLPPTAFGNKPSDGGFLIVEPGDYERFATDPVASKYLRPYLMGRELLYSEPRWCLWLVNLNPADLRASPLLKERVEAVRDFRAGSAAASTREWADKPYLFKQFAHRDVPHLVIPAVSSETRRFIPCAHVGPEVIGGNKVYVAEDPEGLAFAVISSSAFITWQKAIGGRLKSDLSFGNTLTWNTFPLPGLTDGQRAAIIAGGQAVLDARARHPERSLADHYNPLAMAPELLKAHAVLDRAVDAALGLRGPVTEDQRLSRLFALYDQLTTAGQLPPRAKEAGPTASSGRWLSLSKPVLTSSIAGFDRRRQRW